MRVSIVTISFNQARFLERAIRSVTEQDYPDIEYIVVDPGSTDGSRDIIARYSSKISKTILERDRGAANGLNKGFAAASGQVFAYLNSDDALLPGAVSAAVREFKRHPDIDVVYANGYRADQHGKFINRTLTTKFTNRLFKYGYVTFQQQSTFFKAEAFRETGGFNEENRTCWDGELLLDMVMAGKKFLRVNEYWSVFTLHPDGISGSGRLAQEYEVDLKRLFRKLTGHDARPIDILKRRLAWFEKQCRNPLVPLVVAGEKFVRPRGEYPL